jgi:aminoglycoside phosphotransferase (APT) family kinase protein
MQSLSKTPVPFDSAQRIISQHFGRASKISSIDELKEGFFNAAYRIRLENGEQCVLKVAPSPDVPVLRYEQDIMRAEVETMRLVKALTEMPVPKILFFDDSRILLPSSYFGMEFVNGIPLHQLRETLSQSEQSEIDLACGRYLRQMNSITGNQFGLYAHPEKPLTPWAVAFENLMNNVLQDGKDAEVELPFSPKEIIDIIHSHLSCLNEVQTPVLVHWDLWDGNVFIDPQTRKINGIIDFERSLWADPLMEVNFGAFGINHNFLSGYGQSFPFSPSQSIRRILYNVYLFLIMVIECAYRRYPNNDQETWARSRLIDEFSKLKNIKSAKKTA